MTLIPVKLELPTGEDLEQTIYLPDIPFPGDSVWVESTEMIVIRRHYHALLSADVFFEKDGLNTPTDRAPAIPSIVLQVRLKK